MCASASKQASSNLLSAHFKLIQNLNHTASLLRTLSVMQHKLSIMQHLSHFQAKDGPTDNKIEMALRSSQL
jgi:hypothetical protein